MCCAHRFCIDTIPRLAAEFVLGSIHPPPAPFGDGERISSTPPPAIGERVGKAGPDLLRSPMMRCSHARFSRCESHGAYIARCVEGQGGRNHPQRMPGIDRKDVWLRELEYPVGQD